MHHFKNSPNIKNKINAVVLMTSILLSFDVNSRGNGSILDMASWLREQVISYSLGKFVDTQLMKEKEKELLEEKVYLQNSLKLDYSSDALSKINSINYQINTINRLLRDRPTKRELNNISNDLFFQIEELRKIQISNTKRIDGLESEIRELKEKLGYSIKPKGININVNNNCGLSLKLAIHYKNSPSSWSSTGWWIVHGYNGAKLLDSNGKKLIAYNSKIYFFAEAKDIFWGGKEKKVTFQNRSLNMGALTYVKKDNEYRINMNCKGLDPYEGKYLIGFNGTDVESFEYKGKKYNYGVIINYIKKGMPAESQGLLKGDIIYQVSNYKVQSMASLLDYINDKRNAGKPIQVNFIRNGKLRSKILTPRIKNDQ